MWFARLISIALVMVMLLSGMSPSIFHHHEDQRADQCETHQANIIKHKKAGVELKLVDHCKICDLILPTSPKTVQGVEVIATNYFIGVKLCIVGSISLVDFCVGRVADRGPPSFA